MIGTLDSQVIEKFKEFQKETGKYLDLDIEDVEFEECFPFNDDENVILIGSKNIASHEELSEINDKNGLPVYDASSNINTYVDENKFPNQVFEVENNDNPDISFASEGNSSAGTNFIIHQNKYFVNNHRTVMKFTNKYYSKYIYYNIFRMKEKYGFKRGYTPSQKELKRLEIRIPIPKDYNEKYKSTVIQKAIVEFLEFWKINYTDVFRQTVTHQKPILEKIKKALISATLRHDKTIVNSFNEFAKVKDYDVKLENIIFNNKPFFELVTVTNGSEFPAGYVKRKEVKGDIPLISAGVKKDIMGYIKSLQGNNVNIPEKHYVFNDTKQKWNEVKHYNGKDYYTLTADGEGGNIIKRSVNNYPKGFYTTNVCKTLEFDENVIYDSFFYLSYKYTKYKYNFDFANKANNDNLALINIPLPKKYEDFDSINLQKILVEFWEMILNNIDERCTKFDNIERLTDKLDEAFLYRTFSKIEWR
jgi:hypothetical protein